MSTTPEGSHTITPQLVVNGGAGAIALYKQLFGAVERVRIQVPGSDKIFHAAISIGDTTLFLADETPGSSQTAPKDGAVGARFYLYVDDVDAQHTKAKAAGMREIAAPENMPWGDRMSIVLDRYGQLWSLAARIRK